MNEPAFFNLVPEPSAPKLMFFGDPHGDFEPVIAAAGRDRPEAIVLLGDPQPRQPLHIELQSIRNLTQIFSFTATTTPIRTRITTTWGGRNLRAATCTAASSRSPATGRLE